MKISMDGRGRYQDNILVERLWRTVKYEEVYLKAYANGLEARRGLREYFRFYNHRRPHQALGYRTPAEVFHGEPVEEELKERRCPDQPVLVSYCRSAGVPLNCGLILSNRWGPPHSTQSRNLWFSVLLNIVFTTAILSEGRIPSSKFFCQSQSSVLSCLMLLQ